MAKKVDWRIAAVTTVMLAIAALLAYPFFSYRKFQSNALTTNGRVIAIKQTYAPPAGKYPKLHYINTIEFKDETGKMVVLNIDYSIRPSFNIGDTIILHYNPKNPQEAVIYK